MTDGYRYFLKLAGESPSDEFRSLWRHAGDAWEYLSLIDWSWHAVPDDRVKRPPTEQRRVEIDADRAAELEADRHSFMAYWALYDADAYAVTSTPRTVVRRRRSPELVLDEAYSRRDGWIRTGEIAEWHSPGASQPPTLVPLEATAADELLLELTGVRGATQLGEAR